MESEKGMTMKRTEEEEVQVAPMRVHTPKKVGGGSVVVFGEPKEEEEILIESAPPSITSTRAVSDKMKEVVAVHAPEDTPEIKEKLGEKEMQQVSYEDWVKSKEVALTSSSASVVQDANKRINDLLGKPAQDARNVLEDMRNKKQLVSYRFLPIGMPMSMEVEPGRVQILVDASKKVIDISVS